MTRRFGGTPSAALNLHLSFPSCFFPTPFCYVPEVGCLVDMRGFGHPTTGLSKITFRCVGVLGGVITSFGASFGFVIFVMLRIFSKYFSEARWTEHRSISTGSFSSVFCFIFT
jgi:hypothetical protein